MNLVQLSNAHAALVVDVDSGEIVHWGAPTGALADTDLGRAVARPLAHGSPDSVAALTAVPEHGSGWPGRPKANSCGSSWPSATVIRGPVCGASTNAPIANFTGDSLSGNGRPVVAIEVAI